MKLLLDGAHRLRIVSDAGETLHALSPPPGYGFSHLIEGQAAVVCRGDVPREGWRDWRFDVDPASGGLVRSGPAY